MVLTKHEPFTGIDKMMLIRNAHTVQYYWSIKHPEVGIGH